MKDTVTLNFSKVAPEIHATFVVHAMALGYVIVVDKAEDINDSPNQLQATIPTLHNFDVPEGVNIDSAGEEVPKSNYCKENLTDTNFICELPKGPIRGGFLPMERNFESLVAVTAIKELAQKTGRKFRVGTALELLLFWKNNRSACPRYFVAFGTIWNGKVLDWDDDCAKFSLGHWDGEWFEGFQVFFVEDLEPSATPS